jgi:hypothetical protein
MRPIRRGLAAIVLHSEITAPGAIYWGSTSSVKILNCDDGAIYRVPSIPKCGFTVDVLGYKGSDSSDDPCTPASISRGHACTSVTHGRNPPPTRLSASCPSLIHPSASTVRYAALDINHATTGQLRLDKLQYNR